MNTLNRWKRKLLSRVSPETSVIIIIIIIIIIIN